MAGPIRLPKPLVSGDSVAVVAASSCLEGEEARARLDAGIAILEGWGLVVERKPLRSWGYLAGNDHERSADLRTERPCKDPAVSLLACMRGGWGSARLLERPLAMGPNWLLGFSDVTSLLWAQVAQVHGGAIHGPLLTSLAAEPAWSQQRLRSLLFGEPLADLAGEGWCPGLAEGPLLVANLTVATHLLGTPHWPDLDGAILVLEDVGEAPYRIERMLTHWRLGGALQRLGVLAWAASAAATTPPLKSARASAWRRCCANAPPTSGSPWWLACRSAMATAMPPSPWEYAPGWMARAAA